MGGHFSGDVGGVVVDGVRLLDEVGSVADMNAVVAGVVAVIMVVVEAVGVDVVGGVVGVSSRPKSLSSGAGSAQTSLSSLELASDPRSLGIGAVVAHFSSLISSSMLAGLLAGILQPRKSLWPVSLS